IQKMPGIAGLIGNISGREGRRRVVSMVEAMTYEPFYTIGVYSNEELGVYAGWVVHPNSFNDCMPIKSSGGRTVVLFDGEIFNSDQPGAGRTFKGTHLAQLYDELGDAFFGELNGTFSGLVVDSAVLTVKLFNDRIGFRKTFYLEDENGVFHFSSEAKS